MTTVAIALSGGIDSAFSAYLLQQEGYRVIGLHADFRFSPESSLPWLERITSFLNIPLEIFSLQDIFRRTVVDYFISQYARGRTPNPCVVCNPTIKFGFLKQQGMDLGADFFATGHYARIVPAPWGKGLTIARGLDQAKDQSYFLHRLKASELNRILFPLGVWTKDQVKARARQIGLPMNPQGESQDICFLPQGGYQAFFRRQASADLIRSGDIVDRQGKKLGTHQGLYAYTVGQRRGLGIPAAEPYYVLRLEPDHNRLVVGGRKDLESAGCFLSDFHFFGPWGEIAGPTLSAQIRYRHKPVPAAIRINDARRPALYFEKPQKAVTPGQAAVLYADDLLVGGGWIEEPW